MLRRLDARTRLSLRHTDLIAFPGLAQGGPATWNDELVSRSAIGKPATAVLGCAAAAALLAATPVLAPVPAQASGVSASAPPPCGAGTSGGVEAVAPAPSLARGASFAVGICTLELVDPTRRIRLPGGRTEPRTLTTYVRYPALGSPALKDVPGAPAARTEGSFPLVVFAHGFAVTPAPYSRMLQSWARAGYVVAAPVFPGERAGAPGGPDEADVVNEPTDISFVISSLLTVSASGAGAGPLNGLIDPGAVAVAGQSDGGEAALAAAYSRRYADPRIRAAIVLSGAEMSGVGGYRFAPGGPALLAAQGTADTFNEPRYAYAYFRAARRPKYLLRLLGAGHLPPYTTEQPQLGIVERVSVAFLDAYLEHDASALGAIGGLGSVPGIAVTHAEP